MVHQKPENIKCEACDFKTAYKSALKMHTATVHDSRETYRWDFSSKSAECVSRFALLYSWLVQSWVFDVCVSLV